MFLSQKNHTTPRRKKLLRTPVVLSLIALCSASFVAQAEEIQELDAITIPASRLNADVAGTPIYVIDRAQIEQSTARNIAELLVNIPGISVRQLYGTAGTAGTIDLRGFGPVASVNTLILVDGRRMNDVDLSSTDLGGTTLTSIERIEVQPAGGSVLYGDGASGGTINIITRQAQKSGASISAAAGSYSTIDTAASAELAQKNAAFGISAQHQETDGYRKNSAVKRDTASLNFRVKNNANEWYFLTQGGHLDSQLPGARTVNPATNTDEVGNDPRGTSTPNNYGDETRYQSVLGWKHQINNQLAFILDGDRRHKQQWSFFDYGGGYTVYTNTSLDTFSVTPRLRYDNAIGSVRSSVQAGADWHLTNYNSLRGQAKNSAPIHHIDIDAGSRSPYVFLNNQWKQTTLSAGLRKTLVSQQSNDTYDATAPGGAWDSQALPTLKNFSEKMYEIGLSQEIFNTGLTAMLSSSRSVRFSTVDESFQFDNTIFANAFTAIRPQIGRNLEGSLVYAIQKSKVSATLYQQKLRDEIQFNANTFTNENIDPTQRRGATFAANTELFNRLRINTSYTHQRATFREGTLLGKSVALVPKSLASLSLQWQISPMFDVALSDAYTGSQYFENDNSNTFAKKIPAHQRMDARAGLKTKHFSAGLTVSNLADKKYFDYGVSSTATPGKYNAYPMPGREFRLDIGANF